MDSKLKDLIDKLPSSPIELTKHNQKKIYAFMPVPTDYKILWADIPAFGGYPNGIVITDKGLVFKAPRAFVKRENRIHKEEAKQSNKKSSKAVQLKTIYQIILWDYFDPLSYSVSKTKDGLYSFKVEESELTVFSSFDLYKLFNDYHEAALQEQQRLDELVNTLVFTKLGTIDLDNTYYNAMYGADQSPTGHGNYAEDAGVILDVLHGDKATPAGRDIDPSTGHYYKDGPDKFVNGSPIQCKYCKTAGSSVTACFRKNPTTGQYEFRYYGLDGNPMPIEVAKDQYEAAVKSMENRIKKGQVPGVSNPSMAQSLIRKGLLTSKQARNLAKAGTFESLTYDAVTGVVSCTAICGISSLVSFGLVYWKTKDIKKAGNAALKAGIQVFGPAFAGRILAAQLARTNIPNLLRPITNEMVKKLSPQTVQRIINSFRSLAGKKPIYGSAARKSFVKALNSTAITEVTMFVIMSIPDTISLSTKKMSGAQYAKNMSSALGSIAGYAAASYETGRAVGKIAEKYADAAVGRWGKPIGFVGGCLGGMVVNSTVRGIGNLFKEDDSIITTRLFNSIFSNMCMDYLLSEEEFDTISRVLEDKQKEITKLQAKLISSTHQSSDIEQFLNPLFEDIVKQRETISAEMEEKMSAEIDDAIENATEATETEKYDSKEDDEE